MTIARTPVPPMMFAMPNHSTEETFLFMVSHAINKVKSVRVPLVCTRTE
jgi:hypothetical protein